MSAIDANAIKAIVDLANAGQRLAVQQLPGGRGDYFVHGPSGVEYRREPNPGHGEKLLDVDSFVRLVGELNTAAGKGELDVDWDPEVYVGRRVVRLVYDRAKRQDFATCTLTETPEFTLVKQMTADKVYDQRALVRLLRVTLSACGVDPNLINLLRQLKWSSAGDVESTLKHGRESMGKALTSEVRGESAIPDEFTATIRLYREVPLAYSIRFYLEPKPEERMFVLLPFAGSLRVADEQFAADLQKLIRESLADVPVYFGGE